MAGTQLESCTRRSMTGFHGAVEEVADASGAEHIGDFVRVADRGGHAMAQHATVKLRRRDKRRFHMQMGVDEARHDDLAG